MFTLNSICFNLVLRAERASKFSQVAFRWSKFRLKMLTKSTELPTMEELEVPEIKMTAVPLLAAALHMGKFCDQQSKVFQFVWSILFSQEFMLCNQEHHDPRKCLKEGKEVTSCGLKFLKLLKKNCADEFTPYYQCIWRHGGPTFSIQKWVYFMFNSFIYKPMYTCQIIHRYLLCFNFQLPQASIRHG